LYVGITPDVSKSRDRIGGTPENISPPLSPMPLPPHEEAAGDSLTVELNASHILASTAVN